MLENLFTNVFGRPKNKPSGRNLQHDSAGTSLDPSAAGSAQMTGPFSAQVPQMPQPPNLPYPPAPYPSNVGSLSNSTAYYPSLPFSQPPPLPGTYGSNSSNQYNTMAAQVSPLDSVPFEAKLTLSNSTDLVSLDQLFKEIKKAADVVDRADAYLRSNQSDYDFKIEQGLIYQ